MCCAPTRQDVALLFASGGGLGDLLDRVNSERTELTDQNYGSVLIRQTTTHEFTVRRGELLIENRDSAGHARMDQIRGLKNSCAASVDRDDNHIRS